MAETNPIKLLLNQNSKDDVIDAPAFSITKVLTTSAVFLTPLVTYLVKKVQNITFSAGQMVVLISAVLALLAVLGAADVLARAIATSRSTYPANPVEIKPPLKASWSLPGEDKNVRVIACRTQGSVAEFLAVGEDDELQWVPQSKLTKFTS
jgi:hypothetical protein